MWQKLSPSLAPWNKPIGIANRPPPFYRSAIRLCSTRFANMASPRLEGTTNSQPEPRTCLINGFERVRLQSSHRKKPEKTRASAPDGRALRPAIRFMRPALRLPFRMKAHARASAFSFVTNRSLRDRKPDRLRLGISSSGSRYRDGVIARRSTADRGLGLAAAASGDQQ